MPRTPPRSVASMLNDSRLARPLRSTANRVIAARAFDRGRAAQASENAKRLHLLDLLRAGNHRIFVESGTYLGVTVAFLAPHADRVVSIEIDEDLWRRAQNRFAAWSHVDIVHGDAIAELPRVVDGLGSAPLIWLDGHYSGRGTGKGAQHEPAPTLLRRLAGVSPPAGTTIVVDDLRLFGTDPDFPTLEELLRTASEAFPAARMRVALDALIMTTMP